MVLKHSTGSMTVSSLSTKNILEEIQANPVTTINQFGWAIGYGASEFLNSFYESAGSAYFSRQKIHRRIEFLYKLNKERREPGVFDLYIRVGVVCVKDLSGRHNGIRLMLLRGMTDTLLLYYAIRQFVDQSEPIPPFLSSIYPDDGKPTFERVFDMLTLETSPSFFGAGEELDYAHVFEEDYLFWNFQPPVDDLQGVTIYPRSEGFYNLSETVSVARLIVLVSNTLGFRV